KHRFCLAGSAAHIQLDIRGEVCAGRGPSGKYQTAPDKGEEIERCGPGCCWIDFGNEGVCTGPRSVADYAIFLSKSRNVRGRSSREEPGCTGICDVEVLTTHHLLPSPSHKTGENDYGVDHQRHTLVVSAHPERHQLPGLQRETPVDRLPLLTHLLVHHRFPH